LVSGHWETVLLALLPFVLWWATDVYSHRRRTEALSRTARSVGLDLHGAYFDGEWEDRRVRITRTRSQGAILSIELGPDVAPELFASRVGRTSLLWEDSLLTRAFDALFQRAPDATVRGGMLIIPLESWPDSQQALTHALMRAGAAADALDADVSAAATRWREGLAALGLVERESCLEGAYRHCDLVLERVDLALALTAPLGPHLPAKLAMGRARTRHRVARWLRRSGSEVSVPGLAGLVHIESSDAERVRHLLSHWELTQALVALFELFPHALIEKGELKLMLAGWLRPVDQLRKDLDVVANLIVQLQQWTDWPGKRPSVDRRANSDGA
jgi:hypothetical protein